MYSLYTRQLLAIAAHWYQKEREVFSRAEIAARLNEIKYLSAQKKVPKLTLRKEIVHLERQLQSVFELEKRLLKTEKQESAKVTVLKKQITQLKKQLATLGDQDIHSKVEKVAFLIGDCLAKKDAQEEVELCQKVESELEKQNVRTVRPGKIDSPAPLQMEEMDTALRVRELMQRMIALRDELQLQKQMGHTNSQQATQIDAKITLLEQKIGTYNQQQSSMLTQKINPLKENTTAEMILQERPKHTLLLKATDATAPVMVQPAVDVELEKLLPLPPPPRMMR